MPKPPNLSDSEWEVMNILWEEPRLSAAEVYRKLSDCDWKPNTVRTFLDRLVQKKAIRVTREAGVGRYETLWKREDCIRREGESFLRRVFQGAAGPLLLHFAESSRLSASDLEELKQILGGKKSPKKKTK